MELVEKRKPRCLYVSASRACCTVPSFLQIRIPFQITRGSMLLDLAGTCTSPSHKDFRFTGAVIELKTVQRKGAVNEARDSARFGHPL